MSKIMNTTIRKRNKIVMLVIIAILIISVFIGGGYVYSKYFYADKYPDLNHIAANQILSQNEQDYYVYVFLDMCPDCKVVSDQVRKFNKSATLYAVDADDVKGTLPRYDWITHRSKYDIEIGMKEGNKVEYFDQAKAEAYLKSSKTNDVGHTMRYVEKVADDAYMEKNPKAKKGYVYASLATPFLDYSEINNDTDICIPGYPILFHIVDGKIFEYYFDAPEVGPFIDNYLGEEL